MGGRLRGPDTKLRSGRERFRVCLGEDALDGSEGLGRRDGP